MEEDQHELVSHDRQFSRVSMVSDLQWRMAGNWLSGLAGDLLSAVLKQKI